MTSAAPDLLKPFFAFIADSGLFSGGMLLVYEAQQLARQRPDEPLGQHFAEYQKRASGRFGDVASYFGAQLFVARVSSVEVFLKDLAAAVVRRYPEKVGSAQFTLAQVLSFPSTDAMVDAAIASTFDKLIYERPAEYFKRFCDVLSVDRSPLEATWSMFVEAKARRDLGVHNGWKFNETYLRKVSEAGITPGARLGENAVPDQRYLVAFEDQITDFARQLTIEVLRKHAPEHASEFQRTTAR
jgi:hypothetical protein